MSLLRRRVGQGVCLTMGKVFVILLIVLGIWTGLEVMNNGTGGAFGGLFAKVGLADAAEGPEQSTPRRTVDSVDRAYRAGENRVDRALE